MNSGKARHGQSGTEYENRSLDHPKKWESNHISWGTGKRRGRVGGEYHHVKQKRDKEDVQEGKIWWEREWSPWVLVRTREEGRYHEKQKRWRQKQAQEVGRPSLALIPLHRPSLLYQHDSIVSSPFHCCSWCYCFIACHTLFCFISTRILSTLRLKSSIF